MRANNIQTYRAALILSQLDDAARDSTLAGIQKAAPTSPLAQNTQIAASLATLGTKGAALKTDNANVAGYESLLTASVAARDISRHAFDMELATLKQLVESQATNGGDVTSMGFQLFVATKLSKAPPDPPANLLIKPGRAHGKARVAVAGNGYLGSFVAEVSPDPPTATSWSPLPGTGKQRTLTGYATGTKLWVRFARVAYGMQSSWSTPVLVTIP